jgi:hypothetical protein
VTKDDECGNSLHAVATAVVLASGALLVSIGGIVVGRRPLA